MLCRTCPPSVSEHLWRHVIWRADAESDRRLEVLGKAEVDDFQRVLLGVDHAILRLEVAVAQTILMQERDSHVDLAKVVRGLMTVRANATKEESVFRNYSVHFSIIWWLLLTFFWSFHFSERMRQRSENEGNG